jgi:hypothetical protein
MADNLETLEAKIGQCLTEKNYEGAVQYMLALAAEPYLEAEGRFFEIIKKIPDSVGSSNAIAMITMALEYPGSELPLRRKIAASLLGLTYLPDLTVQESVAAASSAAQRLIPYSAASEAAFDRMLDLAPSLPPEQRLPYIREATNRAKHGSTVEEKGFELWLANLHILQIEEQLADLKTMAWQLAPEPDLLEDVARRWGNIVRNIFDTQGLEAVLPEITAIISNPATRGALEKEANGLWLRAIKAWKKIVLSVR